MRRRDLLVLGSAAFAYPSVAFAQMPDRVRRVGVLATFEAGDPQGEILIERLRSGLKTYGWTEGNNLHIELRYTGPNPARLEPLAAELARASVELIVTHGTPAAYAMKKAAANLPIVLATIGDPVGAGLAESLARPGGNITGFSLIASDLSRKRLEILKEAVPRASRVALLSNPRNASLVLQVKEAEAAAQIIGLELQLLPVQDVRDLEPSIKAAAEGRANAIITTSDNIQVIQRAQIVNLAMGYQIPVIAEYREIAEAGALLSYGPSRQDSWLRAAAYVDKILDGAKAADLPIEQPSRFELVINLKSARNLSLEISPYLLSRADEVIE